MLFGSYSFFAPTSLTEIKRIEFYLFLNVLNSTCWSNMQSDGHAASYVSK